jgi:pimeloyl-ACP methyl ester carboxylesterase
MSLADASPQTATPPADAASEMARLLDTYVQALRIFALEGFEADLARQHPGRSEGFAANRLGDPQKPALIYLPGLHSDDLVFWPNHADLAQKFALYGVRYRTEGDATPERYARDILEMMDAAGVDRAHLLGESMGSIPAQWLAARHPDRVKSVVLAGGFARPPDPARMMAARMSAAVTPGFALRWMIVYVFYPALKRAGLDPKRYPPELIRAHAALRGPAQLRALRRRLRMISGWDFDAELEKIRCPFLYLYGSRDMTVPVQREAQRYRQRIAGAQIRELPGAPHPVLVLRPQESRQAVEQFAGGAVAPVVP